MPLPYRYIYIYVYMHYHTSVCLLHGCTCGGTYAVRMPRSLSLSLRLFYLSLCLSVFPSFCLWRSVSACVCLVLKRKAEEMQPCGGLLYISTHPVCPERKKNNISNKAMRAQQSSCLPVQPRALGASLPSFCPGQARKIWAEPQERF